MLTAIEAEDRKELDRILHAFDFAIVIQTLVTWNTPNSDNQYKHDSDVLLDAKELLGPKVDHLNLIQIACFLFNEEMALDMLNFVAKASEELESKKILYEFMGKMWGDGNTTLHLASFLGMADLTKRLLDLGANIYKMNHRKYKPVDCADENTTMSLFLNLTEVVRYKRIGQESLPTSPTTDSGSNLHWNSFKSMGHMRSTSTSTIPLSKLASSDIHFTAGPNGGYSILHPVSTLGTASKLQGLLISDSNNNSSNNGTVSQGLSPKQEPASDSHGTLQADGLIEDLSLTESRSSQELEVDRQRLTILSPIVVSKFSETKHNGAGAPSNLHAGTSSAAESLTKGESGFATSLSTFNALHPSNITRQQDCNISMISSSPSDSSSSASHIRPKLRSYQSSPSIRLYASTASLTTKEPRTGTLPKRSKSGKRVSFDPQSMMADASKTGDLELYKSMLAIMQQENPSKSQVEIINHQSVSRNLTSLHLAASYNHIALCRFLVQSGANVNLTDLEGWTPIHCAAAEGHLEVFEFLVGERDADLQATTYDGEFFEDVVEDEDVRQKVTVLVMAETLQAIYVREYETRSLPKPHTVFKVEVHAAVRTWSVWKRYSEFETLHERFLELFPDHPPPQPLPTKHWWQSTLDNPELLEERRAGLETYLRGILSHRDDRWRLTHEWNDFLAVPVGRSQADLFAGGPGAHGPATNHNNNTAGGRDSPAPSILSHLNIFGFGGHSSSTHTTESSSSVTTTSSMVSPTPVPQFYTTESWLEEFRNLQGIAREVRSLINRRETHLGRSEISASHNCTIQSKKLLTSLGLRIPALENGLMSLAVGNPGGGGKGSTMSDGELRRRQDMLSELKDEREVLTKLVIANRQNDGMVGYQGAGSSVPASSGDRNALMSGRSSAHTAGGGSGSHSQPSSLRGNPDNFSLAESTFNGGSSIHSSTSSRVPNPRRVFGRVVQTLTQETSQTRGLDNEGLLLLQQEQMKQQDDHIEQFNAILQRQKHIGLAIGQELDNQIQLLDELDRDVDRTTLKLGLVNKKIGKIN
ncbi:hypothetical protein EC991_009050 [Linnemannia zychae]|nr:hypothetical protein EC991_009050 [Linnemannia zychae]